MQAKNVLSLLIAILIVTSLLGVSGVTADDQSTVQPGASTNNSTSLVPDNSTIPAPLPDNSTSPTPIPDNFTPPSTNTSSGPLTLVLDNQTYYPNDTVRIYIINATAPQVEVIDPSGTIYSLAVAIVNDSAFMAEYTLNYSIILDNYTVRVTDTATGSYAEDTFEVTTRQVSVTPVPSATVMPDNQTAVSQPLYLYLNLSKKDYLPSEQVSITVTTNAGIPDVLVKDPANNTAYPALQNIDNYTYACNYSLDKAVILGNYTVIAYVNENGTYNSTVANFNVSMAAGADNGLRIQYAAYDPVQKAIVLRADVNATTSDMAANIAKGAPAIKGMAVKNIKVLTTENQSSSSQLPAARAEDRKIEVLIPVNSSNIDSVARQYNLTSDISKATTIATMNANGTSIHLSLNDKVDGYWYRMSTNIPAGYSVAKITRADGSVIQNNVSIDRSTGEIVKNDVNWYVDNGTLYFYDDPINGYDITLLPPAASNSLAVNVIYGGQLSAIIYPFNQTDSNAVISGNDHLGRTGDNGYANNIDGDAGSKTAVRMYQNNNVKNNNLMMFGDDGTYYPTYSNANYKYTDVGQPVIVGFNTVPDGSVESVVLSNYVTPAGGPSIVNITHKTIIRNNNLWFATVYYITNTGGSDISSFRFYQGCDFNFNGQYSDDDDYYDAVNDTVFGHYNNGNPNAIQTGGYRSTLVSSKHDVSQYGTMWQHIAADNLQNGTSTNGIDGGMALAWDYGTLTKGTTWVVPVIWAVGQNNSTFLNTLNYAINHNVFDVGIKSIDSPSNGTSLDSLTTPVMAINATAMDLGVTDQSPTVFLQIQNASGGIVYNTSTIVSLSVPYQEMAPVSFNWNLSGVPSGTYNISVFTKLTNSNGVYIDQNSSNDMKSITVYVQNFSLYPGQWIHANPGDNVLFPLNLSNMGAQRTFDLNLSSSSAGWASNLYFNNTSILIATDTTGDGIWDWVNASYKDASTGLPSIIVPASSNASLVLQKLVPATADTGILDTVTLTAYPSGQPLANSSATLLTDTPQAAMANKTFYLHNLILNTTPESASTGSTSITSIFSMWAQVPAFASNFLISGNISVPIYYTTTTAMPITLTLFYTNGIGNSVQIGMNTSTIPVSTSQTTPSLFNYTIVQANSNVTIPAGSYLIVKIDNQQTTAFNVWYTNVYRSRVDVKTPTYVHVGAINTYNGTVSSSIFNPGDTLNVTANVSDPIGAYDIASSTITITAPNGTVLVNNQTMTLNLTDITKRALWKLYNYSYNLASGLTPGVYGVNITGYESNGVINRKNISITLISNTTAILIYPNSTRIAVPGAVVSFKHTVTNLNAYRTDVVDITTVGPAGWTIKLFKADGITPLPDTDNDGIPDTGNLSAPGSTDLVVQVTVPSYVNPMDVYFINVTGRSSQNTSITSMVTDTLLISTTSVVKTLYLHDNGTQFMNTSMNNSVNDHTTMAANKNYTWNQTPAFARDFDILDDPALTLYATSGDTSVNMSVSLISSNNTSSTVIGTIVYNATVTANTRTTLNFNVSLNTYNVTIPRGNKLFLNITNLDDNTLTINQSAAYPSRIDMDTLSYINVQSIIMYDSGGNVTTASTPPSTVKVIANVTDPFGSFDISGVNLTMLYGNGTIAIGPISMNSSTTDNSSPSLWEQFERNISLSTILDTGTYNILVTANESNGVKNNMSTSLGITYPINVSVIKTYNSTGGSSFLVTINLTNLNNHTVIGVHAYDFFAGDFTVGGFSQNRTSTVVNNGILQGTINTFGPFTIAANGVVTITYTAQGVGDYKLSNMTVVGVDPYV